MLNRIIQLEQDRLLSLGYNSIVTPISFYITTNMETLNLGNDSYILTGILTSKDALLSDAMDVCLNGSNESLQLTQQNIAQLGTSILKLFKEFLIIKTTDSGGYSEEKNIEPFRLDFVKISPIKK